MSDRALLLEIGCEEIPARMIAPAAADLEGRIVELLDRAGLAHGAAASWGGVRRLTVRVEAVQARQEDRDLELTGPPAAVAFDPDGQPTKAALGFARKQGVDASALLRLETPKGAYVAVRKAVQGKTLGQVLAEALPPAVESMAFPKTMRWADGKQRWVRPVHWLVALHGDEALELSLFGVQAAPRSMGHRFLGDGPVAIPDVDAYAGALESAHVIVDPAERRTRIASALVRSAAELSGTVVDDPGLLDEVRDLVEWPGVVLGRFDRSFLGLPRELLITTLRHHQKCFSIQDAAGALAPGFLAIANTDRDPGGHVRRGNEWVVVGRLEDARFFWSEDRKQPLAARTERLSSLLLHRKLGSYADKAQRMERLARRIAGALRLDEAAVGHCARAAGLAKHDLVTGTVGEFPELQGQVGGLMLAEEGEPAALARAVYEHYLPAGPDDPIPASAAGRVVALADKLDSVAAFVGAGMPPTGSRDPFGLRRAGNGIFRIVVEGGLGFSLAELIELAEGDDALGAFLQDRLTPFLREAGYTPNEILAVFRPRVDEAAVRGFALGDLVARLDAIREVREREDFRHLVKLTERVDTILVRNAAAAEGAAGSTDGFDETEQAAVELDGRIERSAPGLERQAADGDYAAVVEGLAEFIRPVDRFFEDVLVMDESRPAATLHRVRLLGRLRELLTRYFDIRELAGQADRRG